MISLFDVFWRKVLEVNMLFAFTVAIYQSLGSGERTTPAEAFGDLNNNCQIAPDPPSSVGATLVVALGFVAVPGV